MTSHRGTVVFATGRDPRQPIVDSHTGYVRTHAHAATRSGYDVHLVCLGSATEREAMAYGTVHVFRSHLRNVRQIMIPLHARVLTPGIVQIATEFGKAETILHGFGVWGYAVAEAARRLRARGLRCVQILGSYTTYLDESQSQWRGLGSTSGIAAYAQFAFEQAWIRSLICSYERAGYHAADRVLVNYRSVQHLIETRFGADVPCQIIPYALEQDFESDPIPSAKRDQDVPLIISISRHDPRKGVDVLIRALHQLKQEGLVFRAQLIGGGPLLESDRRLAASLNLGDRVEIPGLVKDVTSALAEASIFVLPSREEQSGSLSVMEALRAGVACVASGCDGIPEDLQDGHDCLLARPGDPHSLAACLRALITDPQLRERLARSGRETFTSRFSAPGFTQALSQVYQDVVATAAGSQ